MLSFTNDWVADPGLSFHGNNIVILNEPTSPNEINQCAVIIDEVVKIMKRFQVTVIPPKK